MWERTAADKLFETIWVKHTKLTHWGIQSLLNEMKVWAGGTHD